MKKQFETYHQILDEKEKKLKNQMKKQFKECHQMLNKKGLLKVFIIKYTFTILGYSKRNSLKYIRIFSPKIFI